ncbi:AAA domain-containing protein 6 [Elsinoe fawcettii]|nr:AAA domain-containing protein 6 [Elsinoe fawcettii]
MATDSATPPQSNGDTKEQTQGYAVTPNTTYTGERKQLPKTKHRHVWYVTGPAGCGKTTVASFIAGRYGMPYLEGDTFHPPANISKMAAGHPLTDSDRWDWLARVRDAAVSALTPSTPSSFNGTPSPAPQSTTAIDPPTTSTSTTTSQSQHPSSPAPTQQKQAVVVTCSALKRSYRDILRSVPEEAGIKVHFVFLDLPEKVLFQRVRERVGHYMKESMVRSQIEVLERPGREETDVVTVEAKESKETVEGEVGRGVEGRMGGDAL